MFILLTTYSVFLITFEMLRNIYKVHCHKYLVFHFQFNHVISIKIPIGYWFYDKDQEIWDFQNVLCWLYWMYPCCECSYLVS